VPRVFPPRVRGVIADASWTFGVRKVDTLSDLSPGPQLPHNCISWVDAPGSRQSPAAPRFSWTQAWFDVNKQTNHRQMTRRCLGYRGYKSQHISFKDRRKNKSPILYRKRMKIKKRQKVQPATKAEVKSSVSATPVSPTRSLQVRYALTSSGHIGLSALSSAKLRFGRARAQLGLPAAFWTQIRSPPSELDPFDNGGDYKFHLGLQRIE
jgi:hypothetical protein